MKKGLFIPRVGLYSDLKISLLEIKSLSSMVLPPFWGGGSVGVSLESPEKAYVYR